MAHIVLSSLAQEPRQYAGPADHAAQPAWLAGLKAERETVIKKINYTGGVFDKIPWTQTSWMQPQMHPYDRLFYDPVKHEYTVTKYLDDLKARYGGIDALLMWPTCTGLDSNPRRAVPGSTRSHP